MRNCGIAEFPNPEALKIRNSQFRNFAIWGGNVIQSKWLMWTALIVAFVAGYSIVSFLARKIKDARDRYPVEPRNDDESKWN